MTISNYRAVEPLYIVILRNNNQAESLFRSWIKEHRIEHANISGNRMMLHDQRAFEQFRVTWPHNFNSITVWDTWVKRHIYLD
jgi:uncharacterized protein with PIN domain